MSVNRDAPSRASDSSLPFSTEAKVLRENLERAGLTQRAAARLLNTDERTVRYWCAGQVRPPAWVFRALSPRLTYRENLRRKIERDEKEMDALQDGRITGMGFGPGPSDPQSIAIEVDRLRVRIEENRILLRFDEAVERKQAAFSNLNRQWLPHGNGMPTEESLAEADAAEAEFRSAQVDFDRIAAEIRAGKRR